MKSPAQLFLQHLHRKHDSASRPNALLYWIEAATDAQVPEDELGPLFWEVIADAWSDFERIDHEAYAEAMARFRPYWSRHRYFRDLLGLPRTMTVYRGQSANAPEGLSWSLNREIAKQFARGRRGPAVSNPTVLERVIERNDIAMYITKRDEAEIVVWGTAKGNTGSIHTMQADPVG